MIVSLKLLYRLCLPQVSYFLNCSADAVTLYYILVRVGLFSAFWWWILHLQFYDFFFRVSWTCPVRFSCIITGYLVYSILDLELGRIFVFCPLAFSDLYNLVFLLIYFVSYIRSVVNPCVFVLFFQLHCYLYHYSMLMIFCPYIKWSKNVISASMVEVRIML